MKLLFEKSVSGRRGVRMPRKDVPTDPDLPKELRRSRPAQLPELSEIDVIRHFTELSHRTVGVDTHFYPLGSCTMKYNPKLGEQLTHNQDLLSCTLYCRSFA